MLNQNKKYSKRAAKIWGSVKIGRLLSDLGYEVDQYEESDQHFRCDLHGTDDTHPSAHLYYESNVWFCFACAKRRDHVQTVIDKLGKTFNDALVYLETKYRITSDEADLATIDSGLQEISFKDIRTQTESLLLYTTQNRYLDLPNAVLFWRKFDLLTSSSTRREFDEGTIKIQLTKLKNEVLQIIKEAS